LKKQETTKKSLHHGFKVLLDYYAQEKQMTDEAYEALTDGADSLIDILG